MMLAHLGKHDAAVAIMRAIEAVMFNGPKTPDMGGQASTKEWGRQSRGRSASLTLTALICAVAPIPCNFLLLLA
jgi:hypothetical protein